MRHLIIIILIAPALLLVTGCKKFLDFKPQGTLVEEQLTTAAAAEGLVTSAYAAIGNDFWDAPITSMWLYGSVRSDDAYKGGGAVSDFGEFNSYEQYNLTTPVNDNSVRGLPNTWKNAYFAISRANFALKQLEKLTTSQMPKKVVRQAEARFLRGHLHFLLKVLFKNIPYIDETLSPDDILTVSNRQYTNDKLWDKIAEDFQFAITNLPAAQPEVGRANQLAAKAYLAKVRLYQAYEQNDAHQVTAINQNRLNEVVKIADSFRVFTQIFFALYCKKVLTDKVET